MRENDREGNLIKALDRFIFIGAIILLLFLTFSYFAIPRVLENDWAIFFQSLIVNLIPVLLLFVLSYLTYRRIEAIRTERNNERFVEELANAVLAKIPDNTIEGNAPPQPLIQASMHTREDITELNKQLILMADENIVSFSGDLSWVEQCKNELTVATNRNVRVRILCKDPTTSKAKKLLEQSANMAGIQIRYYPTNLVLKVRGMMIDIPVTKQAVFFKKYHKVLGDEYSRGSGEQGNNTSFNYWIRVCDQEDDLVIVAPFVQLFDILWERATPADVFEHRENDWLIIERELRKVKQYAESTIELTNVKVANLRPLHRYIDESEYIQVQSLVKRFEWHDDLQLWDIASIQKGSTRKIICPPIIEKHNGSWIVIDGLARVQTARALGRVNIKAVVIEHPSEPVVGNIWGWDNVIVTSNPDYSKRDNFIDPNMEYWRRLDSVHKALSKIQV